MDAEPNIRQQELADLRAQLSDLRKLVQDIESREFAGAAIDRDELDRLRARIRDLRGQHDYLAAALEGPREEVTYTFRENAADFMREYGLWVAAAGALAIVGFAYPIANYLSKPTEEEARQIKSRFAGQTNEDLEQSVEFMQESLSGVERKLEQEIEADRRDAKRGLTHEDIAP